MSASNNLTNKRRSLGFAVWRLQQSSSNMSVSAGRVINELWHYDQVCEHDIEILDSYIQRVEDAIKKYREDIKENEDIVSKQ